MDPLTTDERIAALLDGRLNEQERARLLAELGLSDDELELLVDSAGITAELEEEDRAAAAPHITAPRPGEAEPRKITRPPVWRRPAVLSAAALVLLGLGTGVWKMAGRRTPAVSAVAALTHPDAGLPDGLPEASGVTRGGSETAGRAASVRFGALATHMELAARSGDSAHFATAADSAATLLRKESEPGLARAYDAAGAAAQPLQRDSLLHLYTATAEALDRERVELGNWLEAARVAAHVHDAQFFAKRVSRKYLRGKLPAHLSGAAAVAMENVRRAAPRGGTADWPRLEQALTGMLQEVG